MGFLLMLKLRGVYCPISTPFDSAGELNPTKIRQNVNRLGRTTLAGYVVGSVVGEGPLLSDDERRRLFELTAEEAGESKQLLASVDAASPRAAIALAKAASAAGYTAVTARSPVEYSQSAPTLFFDLLADRSPLPVIVEARPTETDPQAALQLAAHPNIAGWIGSGPVTPGVVEAARKGFTFLAGDEASWSTCWDSGVRAAVLPLANVVPFHWLSVEEAMRTREPEAAAELAGRAKSAVDLIWKKLGPAGIKWATDLRGGYGGGPRPPLKTLSPSEKTEVERALVELAN